jgi:hypothetical protein
MAPHVSPFSGTKFSTRWKYSTAFSKWSIVRCTPAMALMAGTEYGLWRSAASYAAMARSKSSIASAAEPMAIHVCSLASASFCTIVTGWPMPTSMPWWPAAEPERVGGPSGPGPPTGGPGAEGAGGGGPAPEMEREAGGPDGGPMPLDGGPGTGGIEWCCGCGGGGMPCGAGGMPCCATVACGGGGGGGPPWP